MDADNDLLFRAQRGDRHAFDEFVTRHSGRVFRWMCRAAGGEDAEDLTQEIFFKAFRGLARFRGESGAGAWLASIAHNTLKNRYRYRSRFRRIFASRPETEPALEPASEDRDPEERAESEETRRQVELALSLLPEDFRMPVILRDLEGWNYDEIAVSLDLPVGTVKSRIARGRGQLREVLAPLLKGMKRHP
jgi:RNA polymerase sigma-70 factor (ECF subfamily)